MKSRLHRTRDYYYYRGSRLSPLVGLAGSMVLCLWLRVLGYGMTLNDQKIESEAYAKPIVTVEPKNPEMTENATELADTFYKIIKERVNKNA